MSNKKIDPRTKAVRATLRKLAPGLDKKQVAALSALFDAANPRETFRRPYETRTTRPITTEVNMSDRLLLLSDSRKLYANLGPAKGAINSKAMYSVGRSWLPRFEGEDKEWGKAAREWLLDQWYPIADIQGRDFQTALFLLSISVDRDGDIGGLLTEYESGFPAIQLVPSHSIGQRSGDVDSNNVLKAGPYKGLRMFEGAVLNDIGRGVAYKIIGQNEKGEEDIYLSAQDLQLLMEPEWADQARGFPGFSVALLDLKDLRDTQGYEKLASRLCSAWALMEYNETGVADMTDPRVGLGGTGLLSTTTVQDMNGGMVKHFKANSGSKLEMLKSDRPGDAWESFMNRLIRNAMTGIGWPYELAWDLSQLTGANGRMMLATAMRSVEDRQDLLRPFAKRAVGYACMKAIQMGKLKKSEDWWRWGFTMPPRMTADYGRDKAQDREDYIHGITNLTELCAERGIDRDQHIAQRKDENDALVAAGLPVPVAPAQAALGDEDTTAADLKTKMDVYGIGVRAGALTPNKEDEAHFRQEAGLPALNGDVDGAWTDDGGVRRPITLQTDEQKGIAPAPVKDPSADGEMSAKPAPVVIKFSEAVAALDAKMKEQATLEAACAQIAERRKRLAK